MRMEGREVRALRDRVKGDSGYADGARVLETSSAFAGFV